jgi:preprotein translocase subunit YajC
VQFLPFVLIIVVFWFLIIRPQQKRQREAQQMQSSLNVGSKVLLTSGIFATVDEITDDYIGVEIADGIVIRVVRAAIGRILPEDIDEPDTDDGDAADETTDETGIDALDATTAPGAEQSVESVDETLAKYTPKPVQQPEQND